MIQQPRALRIPGSTERGLCFLQEFLFVTLVLLAGVAATLAGADRAPAQAYFPSTAPASGPATDPSASGPSRSASIPTNPRFAPPPANRPGNPPANSSQAFQPRRQAELPRRQAELYEPAKIIARVGDQPILAGDVLGMVDQALAPHREKMSDLEFAEQREALMKQLLTQLIDTKLLYLEYLRKIPEDRREEALSDIWSKVYEEFDNKELPDALERAEADSAAELDARLRKFGWSLEKQRRSWGERQLGRFAVAQNVERDPEVTYDEMLAYYQEHLDEYRTPAKARWEQLTVRFDQFPNKQAAYSAICSMGNDVYLRGAPFGVVAKRRSQGIQAENGGVHDWVSQGSLRSTALDEAIFSLPPDRLSQVIEDEQGFHIIRVLERTEETVTSFREAQVEIREELKKEKREKGLNEFIARVRERTPVWTIFDDEEEEIQR